MKRKIFSILFALVLICSFSLVTAVPVAAQVDRLVPSEYDTIQLAINAANPSDTIIVSDGTYIEDLIVNTASLTLKSVNGRDVTTIQGAGAPGVISVNADHFTLGGEDGHGFTVIGTTSNRLVQSETNVIPYLTVSYNAFDTTGTPSQAVSLGTGGSNITISHNTFDLDGQTGIYVGGTQANVDDLLVDTNIFNGTTSHASWINFVEDAGGAVVNRATISNNTVTNAVLNMRTSGRIGALNEIAITGNTFKGGSEIFIGPGATTSVVITKLSVTGNTVNADNRYAPTGGDCPFFEILGPTANQIDWNTVKVNNNNFNLPSSQWAVKNNVAGTTLNAEGNWWGDVSGPSEVGPGTGGMVTNNVDYSPWWGASYLSGTAPNIGLVVHPWTWYTNDSIQDAINAALSDDTIIVAAGLYNERLTISKSLDLRGAQYAENPTQAGARTTPTDESVITEAGLGDPDPDVLIDIANGVSGVTIDGFTLIGDPTFIKADTSVIRCGGSNGTANNITISNNIIDGKYGVIYKGGDTLAVHQNRMVVNKVGVVVQPNAATDVTISDNFITLGSTPADDEQGVYMTGCSQSSVTGNTITGFIHNAALAGSNLDHLTVSGNNTFTGNAAGVSIWDNSTFITITDNVLSDSVVYAGWGADSGCGIVIKAQDVVITGNQITNNTNMGVKIDEHGNETLRNTISNNNIVDNANYGVWVNTSLVTEEVDATNNWWGNVSGPEQATTNPSGTGDPVSDDVTYSPWLGATFDTEPMTFIELVTGTDPDPVTLLDEDDNTIATVDISGGDASSGTIAANSEPTDPEPDGTSLVVGTGKTGVLFLDVKVTGYTSGWAHITVPYPDVNQDGFVDDTDPLVDETTLGLYYWDEAATMWRIAANNLVLPDANTVSGDIPVSALGGTPIGMGGYPADEATVKIESIIDLSYSGNDTVDLIITTKTAQLGAVTIDLTFDPAVVEVLGGENSEFDQLTVNPSYGLQTARFVASQLGPGGVDATGGAVLAQVRLKAVSTTGSSSPLTLAVITLKDNDGVSIPDVTPPTHGTATIGGLGDANSDGVVDVYDCVFIARAIAGSPGYILNEATMDVDGKDGVDAFDCTHLARHIAGIAGYELGG